MVQHDNVGAERTWRRLLYVEVALVLLVSLGRSGIYAITSLIVRLTDSAALRDQHATLNAAMSPRPNVDLAYQLLAIAFALVPVGLVFYFFVRETFKSDHNALATAVQRLGLASGGWKNNIVCALGFAALIGLPGLGLYLLGRELGMSVAVVPAEAHTYWWTIPVLVLAAVKNALLEEIIAVGYLTRRLQRLGWQARNIVLASALLRASYHLYQGIGAGIGNLVMGVIFAEYFRRTGKLWPLIMAHALIDMVAFVGYALLAERLGAWL